MVARAVSGSSSPPRDRLESAHVAPRILCWNCRKLTPFELDRCQHCGTAFAGSTGGAYGPHRPGFRSIPVPKAEPPAPSRSLAELIADLQKVHDVSDLHAAHADADDQEGTVEVFQCPACGRFVSEEATSCACGVRFASSTSATSACPECGSMVPVLDDACPVCGIEFEPGTESIAYACPRCGAHVALDAVQCSCGAWFED